MCHISLKKLSENGHLQKLSENYHISVIIIHLSVIILSHEGQKPIINVSLSVPEQSVGTEVSKMAIGKEKVLLGGGIRGRIWLPGFNGGARNQEGG